MVASINYKLQIASLCCVIQLPGFPVSQLALIHQFIDSPIDQPDYSIALIKVFGYQFLVSIIILFDVLIGRPEDRVICIPVNRIISCPATNPR
jgi:hypothetical protein